MENRLTRMLKFFQGNNFIISLKKYSYRQLPPLGSLLLRNPVRFSIGKASRAKIMDNSSLE
jgi:hypothetical protein